MDAVKMLKERRSIRKYTDEVISNEVLNEIVDIARFSPSWANSQVTRYNFISDKDIIAEIADKGVKGFVYNKNTLANTKNLLVLSFVRGKSGKLDPELGVEESEDSTKWEMFDTGLACQTFCLAAHEKGIGTCIFGVIDEKELAKIIDLPEGEKVAALITFGYPTETPVAPPRKEVEEIVRFK